MDKYITFANVSGKHTVLILAYWLSTMSVSSTDSIQFHRQKYSRTSKRRRFQTSICIPRSFFSDAQLQDLMNAHLEVEWVDNTERFPVIAKVVYSRDLGYNEPERLEIVFSEDFMMLCQRLTETATWNLIAKLLDLKNLEGISKDEFRELTKRCFMKEWLEYLNSVRTKA